MFGVDRDAFGNEEAQLYTEEYFLREWRRYGPLGVLIDVLHFIKTPKQYSILRDFQLKEASQLRLPKPYNLLEPIKPVITRWNSYYNAFERASKLMQPLDAYIQYHINETRTADIYAQSRRNNPHDAPSWMRSTGLTTEDWHVIAQYIQVLQPLRDATTRLEGSGKSGRHGVLYEVIPTFEHVLRCYEDLVEEYQEVDFNEIDAPEDHLIINLKAAWVKAQKYWE